MLWIRIRSLTKYFSNFLTIIMFQQPGTILQDELSFSATLFFKLNKYIWNANLMEIEIYISMKQWFTEQATEGNNHAN